MKNQGELTLVALEDGKVCGFTAGSVGGYWLRLFLSAAPQIIWGFAANPRSMLKHSVQRTLGRLGVAPGPPPDQAIVSLQVADNNMMALSRSATSWASS